jgi:hypothetical protein
MKTITYKTVDRNLQKYAQMVDMAIEKVEDGLYSLWDHKMNYYVCKRVVRRRVVDEVLSGVRYKRVSA